MNINNALENKKMLNNSYNNYISKNIKNNNNKINFVNNKKNYQISLIKVIKYP